MRRRALPFGCGWVVVAAVLASTTPLASSPPKSIPVHIGGYADLDACGSVGEVRVLDPRGDGFLAVRTGPNTSYPQVDALHEGDRILLCDARDGWHGIVYGRDIDECLAGDPPPRRQPYAGPCRSGWVSQRYVVVIAG